MSSAKDNVEQAISDLIIAKEKIRKLEVDLAEFKQVQYILRQELKQAQYDKELHKEGYKDLYELFGKIQDIVLGAHSETETYDDLLKPIKRMKKELEEAKYNLNRLEELNNNQKVTIQTLNNSIGKGEYKPPAGFSLVDTEDYIKKCQDIEKLNSLKESVCDILGVSKENDPHHLSVRLKFDMGALAKDSEDLKVIKEKLGIDSSTG